MADDAHDADSPPAAPTPAGEGLSAAAKKVTKVVRRNRPAVVRGSKKSGSSILAALAKSHNDHLERTDQVFGQLAAVATTMSGKIGDLQHGQLNLKQGQLNLKQGQVELRQDVETVTQQFVEFTRTSKEDTKKREFRAGQRDLFLRYLPLLFDGSTGMIAWCPVGLNIATGEYRELVVLSLPVLERFFAVECPNKIDGASTKSFFTSPAMMRAPGLDYKDLINALLLTPFAFLAVGRSWNQMRSRNMDRFVVVEAEWFKQLLADIRLYMEDRPLVRNFMGGGHLPNYKVDGVAYGFMQASNTDKSTGYITQIYRSIPLDRKMMMPVMGQAWWKKLYNPMIASFFDIPEDMIGVHHVVGSVVDPSSADVKTHAVSITKYRKRQRDEQARKEKRKASRSS